MPDGLDLLAQRLTSLRAGGIALLAILLSFAQLLNLPLNYHHLLILGGEWLALHGLVMIMQRTHPISATSLTLQLCADLIIVASLLAFSGGAHNPFFALLLLPLLLTAGILPLYSQYIFLMGILCAASLLTLLPAPMSHYRPDIHPQLYALLFYFDGGIVRDEPFNPLTILGKIGLWLNLLLMAGLTAFFLSKLHQRLQTQEQALHQATITAQDQQHLLALSMSAAGTAHELSTPLGTISLLASEAKDACHHQEYDTAHQALEDIQTLVQTCKQQITLSLHHHALDRYDHLKTTSWHTYLQHTVMHWRTLRPHAQVILTLRDDALMIDYPQLTQAITTLLNNAHDASGDPITLSLERLSENMMLCVHNTGHGFPPELLASFPDPQPSAKADGHGIGLTLAHANLAHIGATLTLSNPREGGALACIVCPIPSQIQVPSGQS